MWHDSCSNAGGPSPERMKIDSSRDSPGGPPRIRFVCRILWPGGVQRILAHEAEGLQSRGFDVDLVFLRRSRKLTPFSFTSLHRTLREAEDHGSLLTKVFELLTRHYLAPRGPDATVDVDLILSLELTRQTQDLTIYTDQFAAMFAPLGRLLRRKPYIVQIQESGFKEGGLLRRVVERVAYSRAAVLIATTPRVRATLERVGYREVCGIWPGAEIPSEIAPFESRSDDAVSVTMWDAGRHPETFLDIAARLRAGRIVLAGSWADPDFLNAFRRRVESEGLCSRLIVTGPVTERRLRELYSTAKVGIRFGYAEEGPGMGSLEALSHGLPLIVNAEIGIADLLKDQQRRLIVDEKDSSAVAALIESIFHSPALWRDLSGLSIETVRPLEWNAHNSQLETQIRRALMR